MMRVAKYLLDYPEEVQDVILNIRWFFLVLIGMVGLVIELVKNVVGCVSFLSLV